MADEQRRDPAQRESASSKRGRTFSFNFSFGRKPPVDDAPYQRLIEHATQDAASSADATGTAADVHEITVDFSDGKLRVGDGRRTGEDQPAPTPVDTREAEAWERLGHIGTGAFPDTARLHRILNAVVTVLGLSIPVSLLVVAIATRQSSETIFYMTLFGLVVGGMIITTFPGRR